MPDSHPYSDCLGKKGQTCTLRSTGIQLFTNPVRYYSNSCSSQAALAAASYVALIACLSLSHSLSVFLSFFLSLSLSVSLSHYLWVWVWGRVGVGVGAGVGVSGWVRGRARARVWLLLCLPVRVRNSSMDGEASSWAHNVCSGHLKCILSFSSVLWLHVATKGTCRDTM